MVVCYQYIFYPVPKYGSDGKPQNIFAKPSARYYGYPINVPAGIYHPIAAWKIKQLH